MQDRKSNGSLTLSFVCRRHRCAAFPYTPHPEKYDDGLANFWPTEKYGEGGAGEIAEKIRNNISF